MNFNDFFFIHFTDWPTAEEMIKQPILKELVDRFLSKEYQDLELWEFIQLHLRMMYEENEADDNK